MTWRALYYTASIDALKTVALSEFVRIWSRLAMSPEEYADTLEKENGREGEFSMPKKRHFSTDNELLKHFGKAVFTTGELCPVCDPSAYAEWVREKTENAAT